MNMSLVLLATLITLNIVAVLFLLTASESRARARPAAAPEREPDAPLQALIDEVEAAAAPREERPTGEAGLEAALERWRRGGKNESPAAGLRRLEHSA